MCSQDNVGTLNVLPFEKNKSIYSKVVKQVLKCANTCASGSTRASAYVRKYL